MTTLAQFRTAIANKLGLENATTGDQPSIDLWVNEGVLDVIMRTRSPVHGASAALTSGAGDYDLDTAIIELLDPYIITSDGAINQMVVRVAPREIIEMRRSATANVSPAQYYALAGANKLMVYPTPSAADTFAYYYVPRPSTLSLSSDAPSDIPAEWHKLVEWYALSEGGDYDDDQSSAQGERYRQLYNDGLKRFIRQIAMKAGRRLPRAQIRPNRVVISHDRSRYPDY